MPSKYFNQIDESTGEKLGTHAGNSAEYTEPTIRDSNATQSLNIETLPLGSGEKDQLIPMSVLSPGTLATLQPGSTSQVELVPPMMIQTDHDDTADSKQHGRYPSFGQTQSQNDDTNSDGDKDEDSIQLSEKGSMDKFKSIEVVKQLHADGEIAQEDFKTKGQQQS